MHHIFDLIFFKDYNTAQTYDTLRYPSWVLIGKPSWTCFLNVNQPSFNFFVAFNMLTDSLILMMPSQKLQVERKIFFVLFLQSFFGLTI